MAAIIDVAEESSLSRDNHLLGLNGLRFLAALVLLLGHIVQSDFCDWGRPMKSLHLPNLCAYLFFVLSGTLAGYKAVKTKSVISFYKKKAKRILPIYYAYLAIVVLCFVAMGRKSEVLNPTLWYYVIPVCNIPFCMHSGVLPLVHLWYIGVLVQFYLVFPWLARNEEKLLLKVSLVVCCGWALAKWMVYFLVGKDTSIYRFFSCSSFDSLFLGVIIGILLRKDDARVKRVANNRWLAVLAWVLFIVFGFYSRLIPAPVRVEYFAVLSALLILGQQAEKPVIKLENGFCDWLGNISYEFYVFQILIIMLMAKWLAPWASSLTEPLIYVICVVSVTIVAFLVNRVCVLWRR